LELRAIAFLAPGGLCAGCMRMAICTMWAYAMLACAKRAYAGVRAAIHRLGPLLGHEHFLGALLIAFAWARKRPRIGRFEVDDVAKENFSFVQLVAPDDDGLEGEGAFAEAADHGFAAGLDP